MKFGIVLKELMKENKISQVKLAKEIDVTQRAISKWINLQSEPTESYIVKCAMFFKVSTDFLLGLEDDNGNKINIKNSFNNNTGTINYDS